MASIRRTLSPVPRPGTSLNGEACSVASPLSKSSSCTTNQQPTSSGGLLVSLFRSLATQSLAHGVFSPRASKPLERSKTKGQVWKRALFHFSICFVFGVFVGLASFVNLSINLMSKQQGFNFDFGRFQIYNDSTRNVTPSVNGESVNNTYSFEPPKKEVELEDMPFDNHLVNKSILQDSALVSRKLLIIVTPTYPQPFQAYYLNQLADTLRMVQPPVLWIVVEMTSQSEETAGILRRTRIMYRHLICRKNLTDVRDRKVHQRNVALSHIENHRLDGIVYFADDHNIFSTDLFEQMRQIRRFGTWTVAKMTGDSLRANLEGPVCNGTQVIGWHINEPKKKFRRFHADMSGFAFNSTILWDPKRWHRPTIEPIRQLDTIRDGCQASNFIEQIVEDESQMEGLLDECSRIMVWVLPFKSSNSFYPHQWFLKNNLDAIARLA